MAVQPGRTLGSGLLWLGSGSLVLTMAVPDRADLRMLPFEVALGQRSPQALSCLGTLLGRVPRQAMAVHRVSLLRVPKRRQPNPLEERSYPAVAAPLLPPHCIRHLSSGRVRRQSRAAGLVPRGDVPAQEEGSARIRELEVEARALEQLRLRCKDVVLADPAVRSHGVRHDRDQDASSGAGWQLRVGLLERRSG